MTNLWRIDAGHRGRPPHQRRLVDLPPARRSGDQLHGEFYASARPRRQRLPGPRNSGPPAAGVRKRGRPMGGEPCRGNLRAPGRPKSSVQPHAFRSRR